MFKLSIRPTAIVGALAVVASAAVLSLTPVTPANAAVGSATISPGSGNAASSPLISTSGACVTAGSSRIRVIAKGFGLPEGGYHAKRIGSVGYSATEAMVNIPFDDSPEGLALANNSTPLLGKYDFSFQCVNSLGTTVYDEYTTSLYWFTPNSSFANIDRAVYSTSPFFGVNTKPVASGTYKVGSTLKATAGSYYPTPTSVGYQWLRNGAAIAGATKASYVAAAADAGKSLSVRVSASGAGIPTVSTTTAAKKVAPGSFVSTSAPKISGKAKVGKKLTASKGTWSPAPSSYSYQWLRNGKAVKGATKATYKLGSKDKGKKISVRVTAKKSGYTSLAKVSKSTAKVKKK